MSKFFEVTFREEHHNKACNFLLKRFQEGHFQEDVIMGLWKPSTGYSKYTGIIHELIMPDEENRVSNQGGVFIRPSYKEKVLERLSKEEHYGKVGVFAMHNHLSDGWQDMSEADVVTERDSLAPLFNITTLPFLGLTLGTDKTWSARFWFKQKDKNFKRYWCQKVKIIGKTNLNVSFYDKLAPAPNRLEAFRRTYDAWGEENQKKIMRLKVGVIGVGSGGSAVVEGLTRIGVSNIVLIDDDKIKQHNLDRLLNADVTDIGELKVNFFKECIEKNSCVKNVKVTSIPSRIENEFAYKNALDCDILFCCIDKNYITRELINNLSYIHLIPVIEGGVSVDYDSSKSELKRASWSSHLVGYKNSCLKCLKQYTIDSVSQQEYKTGDASYGIEVEEESVDSDPFNRNVFPFALSVASFLMLKFVRFLATPSWWDNCGSFFQDRYLFVQNALEKKIESCQESICEVNQRTGLGDTCTSFKPNLNTSPIIQEKVLNSCFRKTRRKFRKIYRILNS